MARIIQSSDNYTTVVCPRCGKPIPGDASRCVHCGAGFAHLSVTTGVHASVTTGVVAIDTTGLPPGATFGPTDPATAATAVPEPATAAPGEGGDATTPGGALRVGQSFGTRYHIIKLLGIGGMGAVYQAWDSELGVAVALKVIRADARKRSRLPEAEKRFKQEINLARQVTHKNVVRIHDLGELDGIKFITMPFVKGEDLSTLLRRELKLPVTRALRLARQIAAGMQAAHDAGVVHRDLKPPNVMIAAAADEGTAGKGRRGEDEQALIMDFGISASAEEDLSGVIIGTFEYMAPEQASGKAVDARADIYAFGLIVYECLIGLRLAAPLETPLARIEAMKYRVAEGVLPLRTIDRTIPEALEAVVMKCLERDPANRYATTADLVKALDELDETGKRLPIVRRLTRPMMAGAAVVLALLLTGTYYTAKWLTAPVKPHDPVTVVIADFENKTGDAAFDRTLEQTLRQALEGASFISAYDRSRVRQLGGGAAPEKFDETAARQVAVKQGVGVVVAGSIDRRGAGYEISANATEPMTGKVIVTAGGRASSKEQVLQAATNLTATLRKALGDKTSSSAQLLAMRSISTRSLEVASLYAAAQEAQSQGKYEDARQTFLKAIAVDPKFGIGYQGLAAISHNLRLEQDADKYIKEALRYLDGMTEREKLNTRGYYFKSIGDNQQCVSEYGELVKRYPADASAHNQIAVCLIQMRQFTAALAEIREAVKILPNHATYKINLAYIAARAGDFKTTRDVVEKTPAPDPRMLLALAYSQVGEGLPSQAVETYNALAKTGSFGASYSASGLGDLALYEGRFSEAVTIFERGAAADALSKYELEAAIKFTSIGYARLAQRRQKDAVAAADSALAKSNAMPVRFLSARILAEAGALDRARTLAGSLSAELAAEPQAHGRIVDGLVALRQGNPREAIQKLLEANKILDTWIAHFDLGRAYLEAGALPQADSEFDRCIAKRSEALSLMDEGPSYGYFPPVYYYQGRVREGLHSTGAADSYRVYLDIRGKSTEDPLLPEIRRAIAK